MSRFILVAVALGSASPTCLANVGPHFGKKSVPCTTLVRLAEDFPYYSFYLVVNQYGQELSLTKLELSVNATILSDDAVLVAVHHEVLNTYESQIELIDVVRQHPLPWGVVTYGLTSVSWTPASDPSTSLTRELVVRSGGVSGVLIEDVYPRHPNERYEPALGQHCAEVILAGLAASSAVIFITLRLTGRDK